MTFVKGQSGNPAGRPPGARNRGTLIAEGLFEQEGEALARKAIERALDGDLGALRLCLDRLMPRGRSRPVRFPLPRITGAADVPTAVAAILEGVSAGELAPSEGMDLIRVVESAVRCLGAAARLEARLAEREQNTAQEQAAAGEAAEAAEVAEVAQDTSAEQAPAAAAEDTRRKQAGQPARADAETPRVVQLPIAAAENTSRKQAGLGAGWVPISEVWGDAAAVG
jgi:hypothetical protein